MCFIFVERSLWKQRRRPPRSWKRSSTRGLVIHSERIIFESGFVMLRQDGNENEAHGRTEGDAWKIEKVQEMHEGLCQAEEEM